MATQTKNGKAAAPKVGMVPVKVDGTLLEVPRTSPDPLSGKPIPTTMIQACALAKVDVPHYCYHPKLPVAGNCRMCLVEYGMPALGPDRKPVLDADGSPQVRKMPRPAIACATPIAPGMEIYTDTPGVKDIREGVLEFLLINHPLDCPVCDQAGECKLQEYSVEYGQSQSRFIEQKVHKPKQVDLGPRIMLDDERCILCSRCIRFSRDIAGDDALGFVQRGSHSTLTNFPGKPFDNNYTLNTVDICPVGALTSKDFRFEMRVWFLKETRSVCTSCATGCNIIIGSREGKIYRYEPRENDAVNACWMCDEGRLNFKWIGHRDRLKRVARRSGNGPLRPTTWETALKEVIGELQAAPPSSVALVVSGRQTTEELYLLAKLAKHFKATTDIVARKGDSDNLLVNADKNANTLGAQLLGLTTKSPGRNLSRIAKSIQEGKVKTLIVFGEDVTTHGLEPRLLKKLKTLIVSDILPNATTKLAHTLLPGCAHAEKRGTFINNKGRIQRFSQAVEEPGEARPEWEFLQEIVEGVTGEARCVSLPGLFDRMAGEVPALANMTWITIGETGVSVDF